MIESDEKCIFVWGKLNAKKIEKNQRKIKKKKLKFVTFIYFLKKKKYLRGSQLNFSFFKH